MTDDEPCEIRLVTSWYLTKLIMYSLNWTGSLPTEAPSWMKFQFVIVVLAQLIVREVYVLMVEKRDLHSMS